mmetsp:Transcript_11802/g.21495  ORF Transcript_11802/g.21495 Transcript_11802/m.21495 type:complete len:156 (+) Transcript_11802:91-558(+)
MGDDTSLVELSIANGTEKLSLQLPRESTIARVKDELASITGCSPPDQTLIHSSRKLTDGSQSLSELGSTYLRMMLICKGGSSKGRTRQASIGHWLRGRLRELLEALWLLIRSFVQHLIYAPAGASDSKKQAANQAGSSGSSVDIAALAACGLGGG